MKGNLKLITNNLEQIKSELLGSMRGKPRHQIEQHSVPPLFSFLRGRTKRGAQETGHGVSTNKTKSELLGLVRGQSMIEMLVAISIVVVSMLGILVLVNRALGLNRVVKENYTATYLAAEGIEIAKNLFDRGYFLATAGSRDFYGWTGSGSLQLGVYEADYDAGGLTPVSGCPLIREPKEQTVRELFASCGSFLNFNSTSGIFSYDAGGTPTKFKRLIIIDDPPQYSSNIPEGFRLDFRVTSAVAWESRGGKFVIQLQDHFLPWRIP